MTARLPYLLIAENETEFEKICLKILKILRLSVNTLSANDKYSLLNRDNLMQPIQIQFS